MPNKITGPTRAGRVSCHLDATDRPHWSVLPQSTDIGPATVSRSVELAYGERLGCPCWCCHEEILADFPDLTGTDIRVCLALAVDRERRLAALPA